MATDVSWAIDGITAEGLVGVTPTLIRGSTPTLTFEFKSAPWTSVSASYTARYRDARAYIDYANESTVRRGTTSRGVPWYREYLPSRADVGSLAVPIEPAADTEISGIWGLVVGGEDQSQPSTARRVLDIEVFVLAERDEYADRDALAADLGEDVFVP